MRRDPRLPARSPPRPPSPSRYVSARSTRRTTDVAPRDDRARPVAFAGPAPPAAWRNTSWSCVQSVRATPRHRWAAECVEEAARRASPGARLGSGQEATGPRKGGCFADGSPGGAFLDLGKTRGLSGAGGVFPARVDGGSAREDRQRGKGGGDLVGVWNARRGYTYRLAASVGSQLVISMATVAGRNGGVCGRGLPCGSSQHGGAPQW